jgi:hypothetical protein
MREVIGYCNIALGDESSPQPVYELTAEETAIQNQIAEQAQWVDVFVAAAPAIERLKKRCAHRVFNDKDAGMYDARSCFICGAGLGFV